MLSLFSSVSLPTAFIFISISILIEFALEISSFVNFQHIAVLVLVLFLQTYLQTQQLNRLEAFLGALLLPPSPSFRSRRCDAHFTALLRYLMLFAILDQCPIQMQLCVIIAVYCHA